jgi:ABC-2 type transport system permease protein
MAGDLKTEWLPGSAAVAAARPERIPGPLALLLRINLLQAWRKVTGVGQQSPVLTLLIGLFLAGYAALAFTLFDRALRFAGSFPGLGPVLIERMLFLLFACLFGLLLVSNLIISYTNLFRNREVWFLLPQPVPPAVIFQWKFIESTVLASWAFLFLIAPLLTAYGLRQEAPWHFYPVTLVLIGLFIILPGVAGSFLAALTARFLDRRAFQITVLTLAAGALIATFFYFRPDVVSDEDLESRVLVVLDRLLMRTRFAQFPLLPSYWLSSGVQQWAEGALAAAVFFGGVLLSNVLFLGSLMFTRMGTLFYHAASSVQSRASLFGQSGWWRFWRRPAEGFDYPISPLERLLSCIPGLPVDARALVLKDARTFWRDTSQWAQTLVLFGLLTVYFMNLRHFSQRLTNPFWIVVVSYLNLGACSLNLATLTTRFVYPQFSLEGKRLWIVGLAPLGLPRVMLTKFLMTTSISLLITGGLILMSCRMLQLGLAPTIYHTLAVVIMALTLNGLATGTGVLYPNLKEDNPSKIVSGFGGTFCLVLSFLYIVASIVLLAVGSLWSGTGTIRPATTAICWSLWLAMSWTLGWVPMRLAIRRVRQFET